MTEIIPLEIIIIPSGEFDANDVQALNLTLRAELYESAVESAEFSTAHIFSGGTKGLEGLNWASLLVTLASSAPALLSLFERLQQWLDRNDTLLVLTAPNGTTLRLQGDLDDIDLPELVSQFQEGVQREGGVEIVVESGGKLIVDGDVIGGNQINDSN